MENRLEFESHMMSKSSKNEDYSKSMIFQLSSFIEEIGSSVMITKLLPTMSKIFHSTGAFVRTQLNFLVKIYEN